MIHYFGLEENPRKLSEKVGICVRPKRIDSSECAEALGGTRDILIEGNSKVWEMGNYEAQGKHFGPNPLIDLYSENGVYFKEGPSLLPVSSK